MAARKPDIQALIEAKDIKKLTKALGFKSDSAVRAEAVQAIGIVGGSQELKSLISVMENTKEELDIRGAACTAAGAICSRLIKERGKITACSTSRSDQRKLKKEMDSIDTAKEALKKNRWIVALKKSAFQLQGHS